MVHQMTLEQGASAQATHQQEAAAASAVYNGFLNGYAIVEEVQDNLILYELDPKEKRPYGCRWVYFPVSKDKEQSAIAGLLIQALQANKRVEIKLGPPNGKHKGSPKCMVRSIYVTWR